VAEETKKDEKERKIAKGCWQRKKKGPFRREAGKDRNLAAGA